MSAIAAGVNGELCIVLFFVGGGQNSKFEAKYVEDTTINNYKHLSEDFSTKHKPNYLFANRALFYSYSSCFDLFQPKKHQIDFFK